MALTDTAIKNAKSREKPYKMGDSLGLFLLVQPSGGKLWRLKYRRDGKEQKLALGAYPEVSLKDARERRDKARAQLAQGLDPSREKRREAALKRVSAENTFELVAWEYFEKRRNDGDSPWSTATAGKNEYLLGLLAPSIGKLPLADIMPPCARSSARAHSKARGALSNWQVRSSAMAWPRLALPRIQLGT